MNRTTAYLISPTPLGTGNGTAVHASETLERRKHAEILDEGILRSSVGKVQ
ncbi:hypothetical protein [Paenibacillus xylanilyticus]|uniref:hypothetical protein n=1 Tax=Paenibacillus xylanilyticus TaxID=248903 RepID=UPI0039A1CCBD